VREDAVRLWRSDFMNGGVEALNATKAPGPAPVKSETALRVALPLLAEPVADEGCVRLASNLSSILIWLAPVA
jgi:hypothetical protein